MHIDFALPVAGDLEAGFKEWQRKAERAVMDYGFHMGVTTWNEKVGSAPSQRLSLDMFMFPLMDTCVCRLHRLLRTWKC